MLSPLFHPLPLSLYAKPYPLVAFSLASPLHLVHVSLLVGISIVLRQIHRVATLIQPQTLLPQKLNAAF